MVFGNVGVTLVVTVLTSVLASSGLWAFISKNTDNKSAETRMLLGLAHDRIISLGLKYIERRYITADEYENLHDYLYVPYCQLGGNGSAKRIMDEVSKLQISKHSNYYVLDRNKESQHDSRNIKEK